MKEVFRFNRKQTKSERGFTLIELLVVISIIAVLMSILMPALSRARSMARVSLCRSNLNSMGVAISVYAADNNDFAPTAVIKRPRPSITSSFNRFWDKQLLAYMGDQIDVFKCPESKAVFRQQIKNIEANGADVQTYNMNAHLQGWTNDRNTQNGRFFWNQDLTQDPVSARLSNVNNPSRTIYFGDKTGYGGNDGAPGYNNAIGANFRQFNYWYGGAFRRGMDIVPTHRVRIIPGESDNGYAAMKNGHNAPRCRGDVIIGLGDGSVQAFDLLYDESYFRDYDVHLEAGKTAGNYKFILK